MKKVIFVCTGNTCRSPMAEGLLKKAVEDKRLDVEVLSRGVFDSGQGANGNAMMVMKEYGVSILEHISTQFKSDDVDDDTLILTMTQGHKLHINHLYPNTQGKTFTLNEYVNIDGDIDDPFLCDMEVYRECASQINDAINLLTEEL